MGRKPKNVVSEENDTSNNEPLTLTIETPNDVVESSDKTIFEKAKDFLKMDSHETPGEEEEKKTTTRGRKKKENGFTFQQYSSMVSLGIITWLGYITDEKYQKLLPTQNQSNDILLPWCRIMDRHTKITEVNPDVSDVMVSLAAMVAYGFDARSTYILMKEEEEKKNKHERKDTVPYTISNIESLFTQQSNGESN